MISIKGKVIVNNVPRDCNRYVVARYDCNSKELWFWGSWEDETKAQACVDDLENSILIDMEE